MDPQRRSAPRLLISRARAVVTQPTWSPDGKWIAYCDSSATRARVFVISSAGGDPRTATPDDSNALMPSWSPDGRWIYFSSDRGGAMNLWKARFAADGLSNYEQVTSGIEANIQARPDPTGKRVAYSSVRVSLDIWQFDLTTKEAMRLTSETTQEDRASPSPDGRWLAFRSNRLGQFQVWLLNQQDGSLTQVSGAITGGVSRWSNGGKTLYFADANPPSLSSLWRYDVASSSAAKVFEWQGFDATFSVSPDDRVVIMSGNEGILKVELSTGRKETLVKPEEGARVTDPSCSPDGQWVAYYVAKGNFRSIWVVPFAGGTPRQVTSGQSDDAHPNWSPDSRLIYFLRNHQDIYVVPLAGGEPQPITRYQSFSILVDYPAPTADGEKILFTRNDKGGDIFLLENPKQ